VDEAISYADAVIGAVLEAVGPLIEAGQDEAALLELLTALGWIPPQGGVAPGTLGAVGQISSVASEVQQTLDAYRSAGQLNAAALESLTSATVNLLSTIQALASQPTDGLPAPLDSTAFWEQTAQDLLGFLVATYLRNEHGLLYSVLRLAGILDLVPAPADPSRADGQLVNALRWDRLADLVTNPSKLVQDVYGWGGTFGYALLLVRLRDALTAAGIRCFLVEPAQDLLDRHYGTSAKPPADLTALRAPLVVQASDPYLELGIDVLPVPVAPGGPPAGLLVTPYAAAGGLVSAPLTDTVTLSFGGTVDGTGATGALILPGAVSAFLDGSALTGDFRVSLDWTPAQPELLLGSSASDGITIASSGIEGELVLSGTQIIEGLLRLKIGHLQLLADLGEGDTFLTTVVGGGQLHAGFDGALILSSKRGFLIEGGGGLAITVPLNLTIGPLELFSLTIGAAVAGGVPEIDAGIDASFSLGPIDASVQGVGLRMQLDSGPDGEFFGLKPRFAFKSPDGLGLALDAGVATGGGYIQCDAAKGQYAGILELALESLSLTAIGLIQTKNADGSPLPGGFSLLVIISVEFLPPVELGFGFSLNGVGGLFGWGRTINADALRAGVRGGSLSDIMFPVDPVGHAPQLIQALSGFFPVAPGRLLIGPFVQIQWGSPLPILTAELGVMVELPAPIRVAVMGVLNLGLPQADAEAVVQLNLDAFGLIDFGAGELSLDASLYHSKIAEFTISGDMALRFGWKPAVREFVVSIGGFFPSFTPPPGFPALKRLSLSLSSGDNPTFTLQAYLAVTSNTVQFGALAQLTVTAGPASLAGMLSFDALIHLNPFGLQVNFAAALTVKVDGNELLGVTVSGQLSGPDPWLISGQASVKVLFISVSVSFAAQLGSGTPPPPPAPVQVIDLLGTDLSKPACWSALPPAGEAVVTVTTPPPAGAPALYAHPLGSLTFHQRTTPLGLTLQKYGTAAVAGPAKLGIISVAYGDAVLAPAALAVVDDAFAPGQYLSLSDSDALSQPAFASYQAGVTFTPAAPDYDQLADGEVTAVSYAVDLIDSHGEPPPPATTVTLGAQAAGRLVTTGPTARAPSRTTGARRYQGTPGDITVRSGAPGGPVAR
jgi:hypothetical protein